MALCKLKTVLWTTATTGAIVAAAPASALDIRLNADATFTTQPNGAAALRAFQAAANYWNTVLTNNVTLNFNVSYAALGANILGQTGSNALDVRASDIYAGLGRNSTTALDATAVANLHPLTAAGGVGYRMPDSVTGVAGTGTGLGLETVSRGSVYDNDDTYNNLYLAANTANAKVLGINFTAGQTYNNSNVDASITFSSNFAFDFDPTDGISPGSYDFVGIAVHEMGHALGFVSGTDTYDYFANAGPGASTGATINWDGESVLSVLDLFRYSTNPPANAGFDPVTGKRYLQLDPNRGAAFSFDGVNFFNAQNPNAEFANFATGQYNGDKSQASHWKDATGFFDANGCFVTSRQIGIMDPTAGTCQLGIVTSNDLAAMDAIGYNLGFDITQNTGYTFDSAQIFRAYAGAVPEPATWAMMIAGFGFMGGLVRRQRDVRTSVRFA